MILAIELALPLLHWVSSGCASFGYMQLPFPPTSLQSDSENDPVTLQDSGQQRFMSFAHSVHHFVEDEQVYLAQFFPDAFRQASESFALHKSDFFGNECILNEYSKHSQIEPLLHLLH